MSTTWGHDSGDGGVPGPRGPRGITGSQGPQGEQGEQGPPGADGSGSGGMFVIANDYAGADIGAKINAADADLGSDPGTIFVLPGDYDINTKIVLSAHRTLQLPRGTFTSHVVDDLTISFGPGYSGSGEPDRASDISVIGSGWDTILVESDNISNEFSWGYMLIGADTRGDIGSQVYGNYVIKDLQLLGLEANERNGTLATISVGAAQNARIEHILMRKTSCLGVQIGGSGSATGQHADNVWVVDCFFDDVAQQPVSPVNSSNTHIERNTFKCGPRSYSLALIDFEANTSDDYAENFHIIGNLFDCRGGTFPDAAIFGIQVLGQVPTVDDSHIGPGIIANNTFIGIQYPPDTITDAESLSSPIYLDYTRDIKISGNNIRFSSCVVIAHSRRIDLTENRFQCMSPQLTLPDSTECYIAHNSWVFTEEFASSGNTIIESGTADRNIIAWNRFTAPEGPAAQTIFPGQSITMIGPHSRQFGNYFGGLRYGLKDDGNSPGHLEFDGVGFGLKDSAHGSSLHCDGQRYLPADRRTSDNKASLYEPQDAPAAFQALSGNDDEVGFIFSSTEPGHLTAIKFYKHLSDGASSHDWTIWAFGGQGILRQGTFGSETASGWQEAALDPPIPINPNQDYVASFSALDGDGYGYTTGGLTSGRTSTPLVVPSSGGRSGGGALGSPGNAETKSYFVDVVFESGEVRASNVSEALLTTTGATDVLTVEDPRPGNYLISAYYRIVTGATDVTIEASWTDADGAQSTSTINAGQAVGSYSLVPLYIHVAPNTTDLKVTVTAGTADQVFVSASAVLV